MLLKYVKRFSKYGEVSVYQLSNGVQKCIRMGIANYEIFVKIFFLEFFEVFCANLLNKEMRYLEAVQGVRGWAIN